MIRNHGKPIARSKPLYPMLLILTATAFEQATLRNALIHPAAQTIGHQPFVRGMLDNCPVMLVETGIGQVNTAHALALALQQVRPECVLQIGIAGAYLTSGLNIGDLALATEENDGELGVSTPNGWRPAQEIGIPTLKTDREYFNTYPLNAPLVAEAKTVLEGAGETVTAGPFVTVHQCSGTADRGNELAARFNAVCESMEGAAAAHLCLRYDVPFLELRAVSNRVEDRNKETWNIPLALQRAQTAAQHLVQALSL